VQIEVIAAPHRLDALELTLLEHDIGDRAP
jgi:hypothetical protein